MTSDLRSLALLGTDDPAPYTVRNPDGQGPAVVLCDHASNLIPAQLNGLGLTDETLKRHIAYDIGAKGIAEFISDSLELPAIIGGFSRLVIDLNRPPDDYTSIREIYDGAIIPGNRRISETDRQARIAEIFEPYHTAAKNLIEVKCAKFPVPAIISVHTCTAEYRGEKRPWHIGVLSHRDRRLAERTLQRLAAHRPDLVVGDNKPYSGLDPYGYSNETHALPQGRPNVTFEVRQDLVDNERGQLEFAETLATVLKDVLGDPSLFARFTD